MADVRGQKIGKYELLTQLTAGGMAELFLGCTRGPGGFRKYVVIKRILPGASSDENFVKMFLDEARITAGFSHPNVAQVFDLGEDESGLYVVMEFIAGRNLNQVISACADQRAVMPIGFSASVAHDCALALHYAHTYKKPSGEPYPVIHRDVAQKNIMVTYEGQVKLLDFGIAKAGGSLSRTRAGTVKGTAGYMSPEQVQGDPLDGRSDVFSLGVVLWEMVTGRRLFSADTEVDELRLILSGPVTPPMEVEPVVPEDLSDVIMKALARPRDERFATARELARALEQRCADLLFDSDANAAFMAERFGDQIDATRMLFEAADTRASDEQLAKAVRAFNPRKVGGVSVPRLPPVKESAPRRAKKKPEAEKERRKAPDDAQLVEEALAKDAAQRPPGDDSGGRGWVVPAVLVAVLVLAGVFVARVLVHDAPAPTGDPTTGPSKGGLAGIPGVDTADTPGARGPAEPGSGDDATAPPDRRPDPAPRDERPRPRGQGEVTLALLPEATVMKGKQELGRGSMVTVSLPAGTHLLTVVGPDGQKRKLSLPVSPGKNKPLKFYVSELPTQ